MCAHKVCPFMHPILWARQQWHLYKFSKMIREDADAL